MRTYGKTVEDMVLINGAKVSMALFNGEPWETKTKVEKLEMGRRLYGQNKI